MKIVMDIGLSTLFLHCMHATYIQMSQLWLLYVEILTIAQA